MFDAGLFQFWFQDVFQFQGDVGILSRILVDLGGLEVTHRLLVFAFGSDEFLYMDGLVTQKRLGHIVHVVVELGLDEIVGEHGVEHATAQFHTIAAQHFVVVLDVLANLQNVGVFVEWLEDIDNFLCGIMVSGYRNIKCLVFLHGKAQSYQFGADGISRRSLCI